MAKSINSKSRIAGFLFVSLSFFLFFCDWGAEGFTCPAPRLLVDWIVVLSWRPSISVCFPSKNLQHSLFPPFFSLPLAHWFSYSFFFLFFLLSPRTTSLRRVRDNNTPAVATRLQALLVIFFPLFSDFFSSGMFHFVFRSDAVWFITILIWKSNQRNKLVSII